MPESGYSKKDTALEEFFDAIDDDIDYVALYYNNGTRWEKREVYKNGMPKPKRPNNPSTLIIPDGTKIIDKVKLKTKVVELYIPASVEEIAPAALYGAYNLKKVVFADNSNLKKIGNQAFAYCRDLTSINLPSSLEEIEYYAFYNCRSLESINLPNNIKKLGLSIFNVTGITSIVVPPYAELDRTFYECKNIESVILSEGLETIGHGAFFSCDNLKSVKLPNSLKKIDGQAFAFCDNLKTISILGNTTKIASDAFEGCPNASLIYYGSRQDLKNNLFFPERTYSHNICLPQNIVYKTEDQNLESILAESFEKTIRNLQKEGLFENVSSFDLNFNGKGINIKLNESRPGNRNVSFKKRSNLKENESDKVTYIQDFDIDAYGDTSDAEEAAAELGIDLSFSEGMGNLGMDEIWASASSEEVLKEFLYDWGFIESYSDFEDGLDD